MNIKNEITSWKSNGKYLKIGKYSIWYLDHNPAAKDVICVLHGYPTCSFDYKHLLAHFPNYRIILHDHLGFGFSDKPSPEDYLLVDQADRALALYNFLGVKNISLFAHDYGTSIATEIIARDNEGMLSINIENVILSNGSMLIDMSQLRPIQKMLKHRFLGPIVAKLATEKTFIRNMKNIWSDASTINVEELKVLWSLLKLNGGRKVLPKITSYIDQRYENYARWIGALKETEKNILILWAEDDPVAVIEMANVLEGFIKHNKKIIIPNSGHYPMIETPEIFGQAIVEFLASNKIESR
jgi:pimeloyl-ACP methyl ester carboxylesterase